MLNSSAPARGFDCSFTASTTGHTQGGSLRNWLSFPEANIPGLLPCASKVNIPCAASSHTGLPLCRASGIGL